MAARLPISTIYQKRKEKNRISPKQTWTLRRQHSHHSEIDFASHLNNGTDNVYNNNSISFSNLSEQLGSASDDSDDHVRLQVIIRHIGSIDLVEGKVEVMFQVTAFWNIPEYSDDWNIDEPTDFEPIYVPRLLILNATEVQTNLEPDVDLIDSETRLYRWTCSYQACLALDQVNVQDFPHDSQHLVLRIGLENSLHHRWKLQLAQEQDTQGTIPVPYGMVLDHVMIAGFLYNPQDVQFDFVQLPLAARAISLSLSDTCLQVTLKIQRESSYYDKNIVPLMTALNIAACFLLAMEPNMYGYRGDMFVSVAFVQIGARFTVDSRLPSIGDQIKMQVVMNHYFFGLMFLILSSFIVYVLQLNQKPSGWIDVGAAVCELLHVTAILRYYHRQRDSR